ncbi:MAG: SRPBCC domain-containing protein [Candidatus Magasanikbacteria bacterium]|jgi:hypothetical protein|nr:SRPBCC domain-containing protein [Candidatus Magasanikbacteria bacterium]
MQHLHFSTHINASKEKVWDTMLEDATYREWTTAFNPGSYYVGNWEQGSEIKFLGPHPDGSGEGGMYSRIHENRLHEFVSIEHLGMIQNGVVDTESDEVKKWTPAFENYTFTEKDGGTELLIDIDVADEYKTMFEDMWPKALASLKELSEK